MNTFAPESQFAADIVDEETDAREPGYTRSNGVWTPLRLMATPHLKSAHAKLAREWPGHPEIGPMADEIDRRDAEFQQQQAEAQS